MISRKDDAVYKRFQSFGRRVPARLDVLLLAVLELTPSTRWGPAFGQQAAGKKYDRNIRGDRLPNSVGSAAIQL